MLLNDGFDRFESLHHLLVMAAALRRVPHFDGLGHKHMEPLLSFFKER